MNDLGSNSPTSSLSLGPDAITDKGQLEEIEILDFISPDTPLRGHLSPSAESFFHPQSENKAIKRTEQELEYLKKNHQKEERSKSQKHEKEMNFLHLLKEKSDARHNHDSPKPLKPRKLKIKKSMSSNSIGEFASSN